jgi:hypothetical protein
MYCQVILNDMCGSSCGLYEGNMLPFIWEDGQLSNITKTAVKIVIPRSSKLDTSFSPTFSASHSVSSFPLWHM